MILSRLKTPAACLVLMLAAGMGMFSSAHADTVVTQNITQDARWTLEKSPYIIETYHEDITVTSGATLTIDPGVTVKFSPRTGLYVEGRISAQGTGTKPILFTSVYDKPEPYNTAYRGDWYGIFIRGDGSVLKYTRIRYAGRSGFKGYPEAASVMLSGSNHEVDHAVIEQGNGHGLWLQYAYKSNVSFSRIENQEKNGVLLNHSRQNDLYFNKIKTNGGDGIRIINESDALIRKNEIADNGGDGIYLDAKTNPDIHDNRLTNNDGEAIKIIKGAPRMHANVITKTPEEQAQGLSLKGKPVYILPSEPRGKEPWQTLRRRQNGYWIVR